MRVVRCLWVVYNQAALWNVIPFHMADFPLPFYQIVKLAGVAAHA